MLIENGITQTQIARGAADKMEQLLAILLRLSRVGRVEASPGTVSFRSLAKESVDLLAGSVRAHQIDIRVQDNALQLYREPLQLGQIWQNLLENAVEYRGDQVQPQIEIGAQQQGQDVVFYVRDNGMGIEPEHSERIFSLFSQLNPGSEGSGLGLALVKKVVELYGGRIWVESAGRGKGSCFMFTLPDALITIDGNIQRATIRSIQSV